MYIAVVRSLADRYYADVSRYTTSAFMRLKLGAMLSGRDVAPHIYESREEALDWLGRRRSSGSWQMQSGSPRPSLS